MSNKKSASENTKKFYTLLAENGGYSIVTVNIDLNNKKIVSSDKGVEDVFAISSSALLKLIRKDLGI